MTKDSQIRDVSTAARALEHHFNNARLASGMRLKSVPVEDQGFAGRAIALADDVKADLDLGEKPFRWLSQNLDAIENDFGKDARKNALEVLELFHQLQLALENLRALGLEHERISKERDSGSSRPGLEDDWDLIREDHCRLVTFIVGAGGNDDPVHLKMRSARADLELALAP